MEHPRSRVPCDDRIAQAEERLRAAVMQMSQAQELVILAKERLARARLALEHATARDPSNPHRDDVAERSWGEKDDSGPARGAG
jgi:hypothetical protein